MADYSTYFKDKDYLSARAFPKHDINPEVKDPGKLGNDWYMQYFQAAYSEYVRDLGAIPYSSRSEYALLRLYGQGKQPVEKYMDILTPKEDGKPEREGYMNISYDIISVAPKFKRIFTGQFERQEHDIVCSAINDKALQEKEDQKWLLYATAKMQGFLTEMSARMGIESAPQPEFMPENIQELEMFMEESFKLKTEIAMEMGIDYAFYLSDWSELKKQMLDDAFELGVFACQDYVDPIDGKIKVRYRDPAKLILPYSNKPNFSNIGRWGYIDQISIAELRQSAPELDEDAIRAIAYSYCNYGDNKKYYDFESQNQASDLTNSNQLPYDSYIVNVLSVEFISSNVETYNTRTITGGWQKTFKEGYGTNLTGNDKRKIEHHRYQTTYKGSWVIGTKYMFDCGKQYDIPRPDKKRPALSLNIYKYSNKSILASIIPNLDSFQLAWLKLQNAMAMASPSGLAVEVGTLENMDIGGKSMSPLEILTIKRQTGDLLYKATTHHSEVNNPNAGRPVTELQGGIGSQLNEFVAVMDYNINIIRQQTGMNELMDASTPNPDQPVRTSQIAVQSANNALQPIYSGYAFIKENAAKKIACRYQIKAINGEIKGYLPSLGSNIVRIFEITKDVAFEDYAIKVRLRPTDEMKLSVRTAATKAVDLGPVNGGISQADYLYIENQLQYGNLKIARLYLSHKEKQNTRQREKMAADNMAANGQNMQAQEQAKAQSDAMRIQMETDAAMKIADLESQNRIKENDAQHLNKMKELQLQGEFKAGHEALKGIIAADQKDTQKQDNNNK